MPEVDVGITPGWGGATRMARLIGRRVAKEVNLRGALHPRTARSGDLGRWNRVVPDCRHDRTTPLSRQPPPNAELRALPGA
jgi:enoyl-CoA hydratase